MVVVGMGQGIGVLDSSNAVQCNRRAEKPLVSYVRIWETSAAGRSRAQQSIQRRVLLFRAD